MAKTGDPVQSSKNFVDQLSTPRLSVDRMSLRGHGRSPTSQPLLTFSIVDYVKDVTEGGKGAHCDIPTSIH